MLCKHCGATLEDLQNPCPTCGATQTEEELNLPAQQQDDLYEDSLPDGDYDDEMLAEETEPAPKKKRPVGLIALILVVCLLAGAAAVLFLNREKEPYTGPMASDQYIVAEYKDYKLTNQMFMYYYWRQFYGLYEQYSSTLIYMGLDVNKPFEDQKMGDDGRTWADFFTEYALMQWVQDMAIADAVKADQFTLTDDQASSLQSAIDNLEAEAKTAGYSSSEEYLKNAFDLSADAASYAQFMTTTYTNQIYQSNKYNSLYAAGMADPGEYRDIYNINIRHVLIKFADSTDAAKAAAKTEAEALYETFKKNPTADHFIQLAKDHSADGSASAGGLIENVYPGQMVTNFNNWCFADGRKTGDHGLIETEYGWHLMFFDGNSDKIYKSAAQNYADSKYHEWEDSLTEGFALTEYRDKITFRHAK